MGVRPVIEDHLRQVLGDTAGDVVACLADDCLLLTTFGTYQGRDAVLRAAERLEQELPNARYSFDDRVVNGELCMLQWRAEADGRRVDDGADSFLIQDGTVRIMTIHYTCQELRE